MRVFLNRSVSVFVFSLYALLSIPPLLHAKECIDSADLSDSKKAIESIRCVIGVVGKKNTPAHLASLPLTNLNLSDVLPHELDQKAISKIIKNSVSLEKLILRNAKINLVGLDHLSKALKKNKTLTHLDLGGSLIGDTGAEALGKVLKKNRTLQELNLSNSGIKQSGAMSLSEGLTQSLLRSLDLSGNKLGTSGFSALSEALKNNSSLEKLILKGIKIGPNSFHFLKEAFDKHKTLQTLEMDEGNLTQ